MCSHVPVCVCGGGGGTGAPLLVFVESHNEELRALWGRQAAAGLVPYKSQHRDNLFFATGPLSEHDTGTQA